MADLQSAQTMAVHSYQFVAFRCHHPARPVGQPQSRLLLRRAPLPHAGSIWFKGHAMEASSSWANDRRSVIAGVTIITRRAGLVIRQPPATCGWPERQCQARSTALQKQFSASGWHG